MDVRSAPPGEEQGQRAGSEECSDDGQTELAEQPAAAGDALGPGEPVGALLEVEDERCGEQDADQAGDEREPIGESRERLEALLEVAELIPAEHGLARIDGETGGEPVLVVGVGHLDAGRDEECREQGEDADGDECLGSLQAPADPGHDCTASRSGIVVDAPLPGW